ncbi:MAG: hypothetical protein EOO99_00645 [Pedobacter sp.]|nr:MAG: hypothetical protein EOO99_00645 [Pedobacter sp.]
MKTMIKLPAFLLGLFLLVTGTTGIAKAQGEDISLQTFYDELAPYGVWINDPQYGYVWRPDVDQNEFRPYYTNGRWAMTEYGNTWVSNYDWGWAPFHYGRWVYNRYNQWLWIPDTVWGPAWVSWRSGGGYYGWAPLGPSISIGINIGRNGYRIPDMCWNFLPYNNLYYSSYPRYIGSRNRIYIQNTVIINNTYVRNNRTYYTGPRAEEYRRATNQQVTVYNINRSTRPGGSRIENNTVNVYTPRPSRGNTNPANSAPRNAVNANVNREVVSGADRNRVGRDTPTERGNATTRPGSERSREERPSTDRPYPTMDRNRTSPERSSSTPQRSSSTPQRSSSTPQRVERSSSAPQRIERSNSGSSSRNSGGAPARSSRGESNNGGGRGRG